MYSRKFVRPLTTVETDFVEVLLTKFELRRNEHGVTLIVDFNDKSGALTERAGISHVRSMIPDFAAKAEKYRGDLNAFFEGESETYRFSDARFPFRFASGGVLPIVRMKDKEYYALIYRECYPVGWNLANGGTDARHELLNPLVTVERELREELLILDFGREQRYVLDIESDNPEEMPEYLAVRKLWEKRLSKPITSYKQILTPLKWIDGPDSLEIQFNGERAGTVSDCFLNINPEDFGIEIDKIAKINVDEDVTLCDGELLFDDQLMDSAVGLFEVGRINRGLGKGATRFLPDLYYIGARRYTSTTHKRFEKKISKEFVARIQTCLPDWDRREWDDHPAKFDLCPVTRGLVSKAAQLSKSAVDTKDEYDVFVSFATEDITFAERVRDQIKKKTGYKVFLGSEFDHSAWGEMIEKALESANCLVAVATDRRHLTKPWPEFEYRLFHILLRNRRKPKNAQVLSYITGFEPADLPLPLPYYNAFVHEDDPASESMKKLLRGIGKSFPREQSA